MANSALTERKMESLGHLAGGIAHDFNNLLTVILNYTELLEMDFKDNPKAKSKLDAIANSANKAAALTSQLLAFSRQQVFKEQSINLNVLISSLAHMLTRVMGEDIELKLQLQTNLALISADPSQILHVLMTLANNARDAMKEGGKFTIKTQQQESSDGSFITVSVTDTGAGMDEESKKHLFEPFYNNTGLNLAAILGIVQQSKGRIEVESTPGKGSTFHLFFPALTSPQQPVFESALAVKGPETILVVEDEDIVRQVACDIIRGSGYNVLEATNAIHALEICEGQEGHIDLVLTDLVMPKMNGPELIRKLSMKFPKIGVIYMSGYNSDAALRQGTLKEKASFVQKPFMPKTLLKTLRDTLDGQQVLAQA